MKVHWQGSLTLEYRSFCHFKLVIVKYEFIKVFIYVHLTLKILCLVLKYPVNQKVNCNLGFS